MSWPESLSSSRCIIAIKSSFFATNKLRLLLVFDIKIPVYGVNSTLLPWFTKIHNNVIYSRFLFASFPGKWLQQGCSDRKVGPWVAVWVIQNRYWSRKSRKIKFQSSKTKIFFLKLGRPMMFGLKHSSLFRFGFPLPRAKLKESC